MENKCPKPLTKEEIFEIIEKAEKACLTVFNKEDMSPIPVCFELKHCKDNLIFRIRAKEHGRDLEWLKDCDKVLLEIERRDEGEKCERREKCVETVFVIGVVLKDECEFEKQKWINCEKENVIEICVLEIFGRRNCVRCPEFECKLVCKDEKKEDEKCEKKCTHRDKDECEFEHRSDKGGCKGGRCNR